MEPAVGAVSYVKTGIKRRVNKLIYKHKYIMGI